jgi:hypothetical protein
MHKRTCWAGFPFTMSQRIMTTPEDKNVDQQIMLCACVHCNENPIDLFTKKELRGLSPNFHIHVSVSVLYIIRIGPHIFLQQNRQTHEC